MATERQIQANRANAAKSTGPITPEGKRISSQNASRHRLLPGEVVLKGKSLRQYNDLAAALILQFQPRNSAETSLIHTMTVARWHLLRIWGIQTSAPAAGPGAAPVAAALQARTGPARPFKRSQTRKYFAEPGSVVRAGSSRSLAEDLRFFARQHRLEVYYDRHYNLALAKLLKLRAHPPIQLAAESRDDDFLTEANSAAVSAHL